LVSRLENHAGQSWIHGQARQLAAGLRELIAFIDGAKFLQQVIAVGHRPTGWPVDKREGLDVVQLERLHAQDHRRQRRAKYFRVRERRAVLEICFVVKTDTYARAYPPATPGPLIGRGLADGFNAQLLDLVAPRVPLDARQAAIDDVANAG